MTKYIGENNYEIFKKNFSDSLFLEGYFETQKYFIVIGISGFFTNYS